MNNNGTVRSGFDFLCLVSRKASALDQQAMQTPSWEWCLLFCAIDSQVFGEQFVADIVPTPSERHLSMWERLQRSAEHAVSNLGGAEIGGELGKEFTMKATK